MEETKICKATTDFGSQCQEFAEWNGYCFRHYELALKTRTKGQKVVEVESKSGKKDENSCYGK